MGEDENLPELADQQLDAVSGGVGVDHHRCVNKGAEDLASARDLFGSPISKPPSKKTGPSSSGA